MSVRVHAESLSSNRLAFGNLGFVSNEDYVELGGDGSKTVTVGVGAAIFNVRPRDDVKKGMIQLSLFQRKAANVTFDDDITLTRVFPDPALTIASIRFTMDILTKGKLSTSLKVDAGALKEFMCKEFSTQMFKRGQEICVDFEGTPLKLSVTDFNLVSLSDAAASAPPASNFGLFVKSSDVAFEKSRDTPIELTGGTRCGRVL
jgi:hypothetical protein